MADSGEPLTADRLEDLQAMGLSRQEAVLYSRLVALGPSGARRISEAAHLPREDSYRILRRLESKGLVEIILGNPTIFTAIEPRAAVKSFVSNVDVQSEMLKQRAYDLGVWLEKIKGSDRQNTDEQVRHESSVRILWGQQAFLEFDKSARECRSHYEGVYSPAVFLSASGIGMLETLVVARRRGVAVRIITETSPESLEASRRYSKLLDIRQYPGVAEGMRFSLLDGSKVIMALTDAGMVTDRSTCLCSGNLTLARGLSLYFERVWKDSRELLEPIRRHTKRAVGVR